MKFRVEVNDRQLRQALSKSPARAKDALQKGVNVGAIEFQKNMREEAPVDRGTLRQGIFVKTKTLSAIISPNYRKTPYAQWVSKKGVSPREYNDFVKRAFANDSGPIRKATNKVNRELRDLLR